MRGSKNKTVSSILTILAIVAVIVAAIAAPYISRQQPAIEKLRERPEDFRFEYFERNEEMQRALEAVILPGMTEERVDEILISHVGAKKSEYKKRPGRESYSKSSIFIKFMRGINSGVPDYRVLVFFDKNSRVEKVCAFSATCPYNTQQRDEL